MSYCGNRLDKLTAINVPKDDLEEGWKARNNVFINCNTSFEIAGEIALNDWSYSDKAVIDSINTFLGLS